MKVNGNYVLKKVADSYIVVALGGDIVDLNTIISLNDNGTEKEIGTDEYRLLKDLGIKEDSLIIIKSGDPEPTPVYRGWSSMRCLYGCPMAQSVEEAMSQAEKYSEKDSIVTTGFISDIDLNS